MELALRQQECSLSRLRIEQELPSTEAIKRMVAAGAGIGYVSRLSVQQELASDKLVEIHCAKLQMKRFFSVLIPQGPDPIGIVQAFSKFITTTTGTPGDSKSRRINRLFGRRVLI